MVMSSKISQTMKKESGCLYILYSLASVIRFWAATSDFQKNLVNQVEISTPINSFKRVSEGYFRHKIGLDPYSSNFLHESPIIVYVYGLLQQLPFTWMICVFIIADLITAHCLFTFTKRNGLYLFMKQETDKEGYAEDTADFQMTIRALDLCPLFVAYVFLLSPYSILNCAAMTTTVFGNLLISVFLLMFIERKVYAAAVLLAWLTVGYVYPIVLLSPVLLVAKSYKQIFALVITYGASIAGFIYLLAALAGSYDYLKHTIGFSLTVAELQPNCGVFWYFFMEMFEHFNPMFLVAFQLNITLLYVVPLSICYRKDPTFLLTTLLSIITMFKPYPSAGDFSLSMSLVLCWYYLHYSSQQILVSSVTTVITTALAPILWDLWIYLGSGNANFYFGVTLSFITGHIFMLTDTTFAYAKKEFMLRYGKNKKVNGIVGRLALID